MSALKLGDLTFKAAVLFMHPKKFDLETLILQKAADAKHVLKNKNAKMELQS